jgi:hypothetical protein
MVHFFAVATVMTVEVCTRGFDIAFSLQCLLNKWKRKNGTECIDKECGVALPVYTSSLKSVDDDDPYELTRLVRCL